MGRNIPNKRPTTENVLRAKARKARNRKIRFIADRKEAAQLGISVEELRHKKFMELQRIRQEKTSYQSKPRSYPSHQEDWSW